MTSRLPEHKIRKTIRDLAIGESAYTVPWAVSVDRVGRGRIRESCPIHNTPGGTVELLVTRTGGAYTVRPTGTYMWLRQDEAAGPEVEWDLGALQ